MNAKAIGEDIINAENAEKSFGGVGQWTAPEPTKKFTMLLKSITGWKTEKGLTLHHKTGSTYVLQRCQRRTELGP